MPNISTKLQMTLPLGNEYYSIQILDNNFSIIDQYATTTDTTISSNYNTLNNKINTDVNAAINTSKNYTNAEISKLDNELSTDIINIGISANNYSDAKNHQLNTDLTNSINNAKSEVTNGYRTADTALLNQLMAEINSLKAQVGICPVGAVMLFKTGTNPNNLYANTTWVMIGDGRHIKLSSSAGNTGGSNSVTLITGNLPGHNHSVSGSVSIDHNHTSTAHTHDIGNHQHIVPWGEAYSDWFPWGVEGPKNKGGSAKSDSDNWWMKTNPAGAQTTTSSTVGINTFSGSKSFSATTNNGNGANGSAFNVENAYITLVGWERTR